MIHKNESKTYNRHSNRSDSVFSIQKSSGLLRILMPYFTKSTGTRNHLFCRISVGKFDFPVLLEIDSSRGSCKRVLLSAIQMAGPVNEIKKMLNKNIFIFVNNGIRLKICLKIVWKNIFVVYFRQYFFVFFRYI